MLILKRQENMKKMWRKGLVAGLIAILFLTTFLPSVCVSLSIDEDTTPPEINIVEPKEGYLYILGKEIMPTPLGNTVILGGDIFYEPRFNDWWMYVVIEASATDTESGIKQVEFYIDNVLRSIDVQEPYEWAWSRENVFGRHNIEVIAYDNENNVASDEMDVIIFNI